jgi:tetratricopeptide (TPR) repeat protein
MGLTSLLRWPEPGVLHAPLLAEAIRQFRIHHAANAGALEALCLALYKIDRFDEMLSVARQGIDIDPQRAIFHFYAAHALSVCGSNVEAMFYSREAARLTPDDPVMRLRSVGSGYRGCARCVTGMAGRASPSSS